MKTMAILAAILIITGSVADAAAVQWQMDKAHSLIQFSVKHLMVSNVKGDFSDYEVNVTADSETGKIATVEASIKVQSIDTGITQRDDHLRSEDFFDAVKFPSMQFKSTGISWDGDAVTVTGDLTIKDVTKTVTLKGEFLGMRTADMGGGTTKFAGYSLNTQINRKEFNLNFNKVVDGTIVVDDLVKIGLEVELNLPVVKTE